MELFLKYLASPLIAAIFTTLLLWFKEDRVHKRKHLNDITFNQLTIVYNKLFILYQKYGSSLKIEEKDEVYGVTPDGVEQIRKVPYINDLNVWDEVVEEVRGIVYPNFHLLMRKDILLWNDFLKWEKAIPQREEDIYDPYILFQKFLKDVSLSYVKLYNKYHLETNSVKRGRNRKYKKLLKNIRKNPFYTRKERKREIRKLKIEEQNAKSKIL